MTKRLHFYFSLSCIGEGNGNPLQCSCLENPRDGGTWWAAVYGVASSRTRLKRLSSSSSNNFSQFVVIHIVKGLSDILLEFFFFFFFCFLYDPTDVDKLISASSAFSVSSLNIWKFLVHILLRPSLENFEHYFVSV